MKFQPIVFIKSFNWSKEDGKKVLMLVIMLLVICFITRIFPPVIKVRIVQDKRHDVIKVSGDIGVAGDVDVTAHEPMGGFNVNVRQ